MIHSTKLKIMLILTLISVGLTVFYFKFVSIKEELNETKNTQSNIKENSNPKSVNQKPNEDLKFPNPLLEEETPVKSAQFLKEFFNQSLFTAEIPPHFLFQKLGFYEEEEDHFIGIVGSEKHSIPFLFFIAKKGSINDSDVSPFLKENYDVFNSVPQSVISDEPEISLFELPNQSKLTKGKLFTFRDEKNLFLIISAAREDQKGVYFFCIFGSVEEKESLLKTLQNIINSVKIS